MKYGLIAGNGKFPLLVLESARGQGVEIAVAAIKEETSPEIERLATTIEWIGVGQLGQDGTAVGSGKRTAAERTSSW